MAASIRRTLYVLDAASAAQAARFVAPGDLLAPVDGLIVFARGGASLLEAAGGLTPIAAPVARTSAGSLAAVAPAPLAMTASDPTSSRTPPPLAP